MSKRILSFLLAFVMVFSMVPAIAMPTFATETPVVYEANIASAVTVDGNMTETAYMQALPINGGENAPSGKVYATWMNDILYLAVPFVNAESLGVTIGEKIFSLNLSTKTLTDAPAGVVAEIAGGVAELKIPLDAVGVQLTDYNQDASFNVSLTNANGTTAVAETPVKLRFTNVKVGAERVDFTSIPSNRKSGVTVVNAGEATFINTDATRQYLMKEQVAAIDLSKDFYYQTTLSITDMEETDNKTHDWYNGRAFYFWISDEYRIVPSISSTTTTANAVLCDLYDHSTNGLTLRVRQHRTDMTKFVDVVLNRVDNGTAFDLGLKYDGSAQSLAVYVDGVFVKTVPNAMCEEIAYTLGNATVMNLACKGTVKVNDLFVSVPETFTLSNEITADKVMKGIKLTDLEENVVLPATYTSANLGELALTWKSSNTSVISAAGVITQSARVGNAKLTASVGGKDMFSVDVSVAVKEGVEEEMVIAEGTCDAFVASDIVLDGNLSETAWFTGAKLGKGQPFDILWDGGNLYFGVVASEGDETMTVKIGDETIATAEKTGNGFEAKVPYTTKDVETIEDLSIIVGKSAWKGTVNLTEMVRRNQLTFADYTHDQASGAATTATATADGKGITLNMTTLTAPNSAVSTYYARKTKLDVLNATTGDVVFEFTFDPEQMPVPTNSHFGTIGATNSVWGGFEATITNGQGNAIRFGIVNRGSNGLWMNVVKGSTICVEGFSLGKEAGGDPFDIKIVWKRNNGSDTEESLDVYVDGVFKASRTYVNNPVSNGDASITKIAGVDASDFKSMVHFRAVRYDYNTANGFFDQPLKFTVSNVRLSEPVEVEYPILPDDIVTATGTYDAFVAEDITVDGNLSETAWRTGAKLGAGQPFDILWDGSNLYFGVVAAEGDETMTVKIGNETIATAEKTGNGFEVKVPYTTKDVTALEDVTIKVGKSVWTGEVTLSKFARVAHTDNALLSSVGAGGGATNATKYEDGYSYNLEVGLNNNARAYTWKDKLDVMAGRSGNIRMEFDFDPTGMGEVDYDGIKDAYWSVDAGFSSVILDANKDAILYGIQNQKDVGLVFHSQSRQTEERETFVLNRTVEDGAFHVCVEWTIDGDVKLYINSEYCTTFKGMQFNNYTAKNETSYQAIMFEAWRHADLKDVPVAFKVTNMYVSKAVKVTYPGDDQVVTAEGTYDAFVASNITLDGNLSETAWRTGAKLGKGQPFDILFDGNNLYFGVVAAEGDETMTVKIGDETVATVQKSGNGFEAKVEYLTKNVQTIEDVTITVGTSVWTGDVNLVRKARTNHFTAYTLNTGAAGDGSTGVTVNGGKFTFAVAKTEPGSGYVQKYRTNAKTTTASNISELKNSAGMNIEFEFDPIAMPVVTKTDNWGSVIPTWAGATIRLVTADSGLIFGITNTSEGLVFVHHKLTTLTNGNLWIIEPVAKINLGKKAGEGAFNVRLDWKTDGSLDVYVDGVKKGTVADAVSTIELLKKGIGSGCAETVSFNAYMHNSVATSDMEFSISDFTLSNTVEVKSITNDDGEMEAIFAESEPTAEFGGWDSAAKELFAVGEGAVSAMIYNQKVYVRVDAVGEVSVTLGSETKTATSEGSVILAFDDTTVTEYGQQIALSVSLNGTAVWEQTGKITVLAAKALYSSATMPTNDAKSRVTIEGNKMTFATTDSISSKYCAYVLQRKDLNDLVRPDSDVLFEQTIQINAMAYGEKTGTFDGHPTNNHGYTIMLEYPNGTVYSGMIVRDEAGNLSFVAFCADKTTKSIDLGKKLGDEFKLNLLWAADGSTTVYVDGAQKGEVVTNARYGEGVYKVAGQAVILNKYQDAANSAEQPAEIIASVPVLTILNGQEELITLAEEVTKAVVFGNADLTKVVDDLKLPTTFQSAYLGERALRWTTSNAAVVEADGTVHLNSENDGTAQLSVYLDDSDTALWSVDVTVPATTIVLNALLSEETVSVDGNLTELAWLDWQQFGSRLPGNIAAAWTKGNVYFGVYSEEADTLKMTINGKEITVDLKNGSISGAAGAWIAKNAKTGTVEIVIPLADIGFSHTDYNQTMAFSAQLLKGETKSELKATVLNLSGDVAAQQPLGSYTKSSGPWTLLANSISYNGSVPSGRDFAYKTDNEIDHTTLIVLSHEFQFNALPVTTGAQTSNSQADGFHYYLSDEDANSRIGTTIFVAIFNDGSETLKLRIGQGGGKEGYVFDLGKTLGEKFRLTYYWYPNNDLDVYLDGVLLGTVKNAGYTTDHLGVDVICYNYWSASETAEKVKLTVSNQTAVATKYEKVLDELTKNVVFGRVDLEHVQKNLNMVTTFASANFAALNLKWTSSDESVVAIDGTITRHETEAKSSTLTVYFVDADGSETKLWDVTVTVDPMSVTKQPAPSIIHTAFAAPGSIVIDGAVADTESWLLNGWVLNDQQQAVGYFGAQWDQEYLYILLDTEAENVSLSLDGKDIAVTKTGKITELQIPVSEILGRAKIEEYGVGMIINVTMDGSAYLGALKLTNVDWWGTDNFHAGLPMLANNVKSVALGGGDPDGNQGAKQLENGWRLYDIYGGAGAANPAGVRTYVLFMKMPVYEGFADRTEATQIEFDFYAKDLPEWDWDEAIKNELGRAFANYGVTFSLSDKADASKNSNVAVFGIVNTANEGLVLVVNRGYEDYEHFVLNKRVGEEFRIGMTWLTNANLVLTIDGVELTTINNMSKFVNSVGDTSFVVNMIRNKVQPTSDADNMDVYLTNIAFGKAHSTENIIRNLTFEDFAGANESAEEVISDLELPSFMTNGQLDYKYQITWKSSDDQIVDPTTGKVTRPTAGVKFVTLTATLEYADGTTESKEFSLMVIGASLNNGNALVVQKDVNPFGMGGTVYKDVLFNLDKNNNSIVYAFPEEVQKINLITLTDLDAVSRLNRESLRLFVSNDNITYTEIDSYKLIHDGCNWYLYNFEAEARYIKVHYTHRDSDASDFINTPGDMIHVSWNEGLAIPNNAVEMPAPTTTLRDQAVAITLPAGIAAEGLRVALNGEILFHYVEDGTVYVRIPDPTNANLKLWNADSIELSSKENVYEVTYGTRETLPSGGRWVLSVKAGQTYPDGSSVSVDTLYHMSGKNVYTSVDGGYTWTKIGSISFDTSLSSGGWGIDSKTGRLFHEFYYATSTKSGGPYDSFHSNDIDASYCPTHVFYSDDGGKTWHDTEGLDKIEGDKYSNYVLSYTDLTELACNDGEGPNVDFVFPMGAQFNNNGAFCGRVAYTRDGGLSWHYSDSIITFGNESAFEGGVSEATILEREDGTLVYYARCQSGGVDNFTISYSLDHGVTWLTPGMTSSVYTTNTQALMMTYDFGGFDGKRTTGSPIFMWGGNNVLGGNSYMRMPLNFAVSTNEMDTFRNIQNIFSETFMDVYTSEADHYITNPSIQQINGDDMYIAFSRLYHNDSIYMVVNNFTDWFIRTKGAYDSFESGNAKYEGWVVQRGSVAATKETATIGEYSMLVAENTQVTRSIPYLQNGTMSIDLLVDESSNFVFELQPAFSNVEKKCAVISAKVSGTTMTLHDGTVLTLNSGWNTIAFDLELTENKASISINGGEMKTVAVNTKFNGNTFSDEEYTLGNYITYVTILATSTVNVDEFFVESSLDAVVEATSADKAAANAVIEQIKALDETSTVAEVNAVKAAFKALTQVQKDLVNRNVSTGTSTNANDEGALINYYDVLFAMTGVSEDPDVEVNTENKPAADNTVVLPDNIELNTEEINNVVNSEDTLESLGNVISDAHIEAETITQEQAKDILGEDYQEGVDVKVEIRPYIAIEYKEVGKQGNTAILSVDIAAMIDSVVVQGLKEVTTDTKPLDTVGKEIVLNVVVPEDFVKAGQSVFVKHIKDNGTEYIYPATYDAATNTVTFTNPNGFSDFVVYTVDPDVVLDSYTLTLKDYVGLNFYMILSDEAAQDEDAYMQFVVGDRTIQVTERRVVVENGVTYYVYTCPTYAKEMNTDVKGQFFFGEENEKTSNVYTYSVRRYADYILSHDYKAELKQLVRDMLQYGAMAQIQFNYNVDDLANAGIEGASDIDDVTKEMMNVAGAESNLTYDISLSLKENVTMKFYFKAEGTKDTIQVTYKGQNLAVEDDNCAEGEFCVSITGIAAKNLGDLVELEITDGNGQTHYIKDVPLRYGYIVLNDGQMGEKLENLVRSIYLYNQSAKAHFG